jgi:hypothetical protein
VGVVGVVLGADVLVHVPVLAAPVPVLEEEGKYCIYDTVYHFCLLTFIKRDIATN